MYRQEAENILVNVSKSYDVPPRPGVIALTDWSDTKLDELAENVKLPTGLKSLVNHKRLLSHFYNFYFNGILPEGSFPHQIIFPFIGLLAYDDKTERTFFIKDDQFNDSGFFELITTQIDPAHLKLGETTIEKPSIPGLQDMRAEQATEIESLYLSANMIDQKTFFTVIKKLIIEYNENTFTKQNNTLLRLTGFLALLLFRAISKDAAQLLRGANKRLIKAHIHNLVKWPIEYGYAPPCKKCIEHCAIDLDKGNSHSNNMMILILYNWRHASTEQRQTRGLIPQIQAALLTHTAGNGLGLVMLLYVATELLGITITKMIGYTLTEHSIGSWKLLSLFVKRYLNAQDPEQTYMWARLINDGYFTEFAARSHPYLAGMFAGIIDSYQTIGTIKEAAWFQLRRFQAEPGYLWGKAVVEKHTQIIDKAVLPEGLGIPDMIREMSTKPRVTFPEEERDPLEGIETEEEL